MSPAQQSTAHQQLSTALPEDQPALARLDSLIAIAEAELATLERRQPQDPPALVHGIELWLAALHRTRNGLLRPSAQR